MNQTNFMFFLLFLEVKTIFNLTQHLALHNLRNQGSNKYSKRNRYIKLANLSCRKWCFLTMLQFFVKEIWDIWFIGCGVKYVLYRISEKILQNLNIAILCNIVDYHRMVQPTILELLKCFLAILLKVPSIITLSQRFQFVTMLATILET